jgi:hypothetical protein
VPCQQKFLELRKTLDKDLTHYTSVIKNIKFFLNLFKKIKTFYPSYKNMLRIYAKSAFFEIFSEFLPIFRHISVIIRDIVKIVNGYELLRTKSEAFGM